MLLYIRYRRNRLCCFLIFSARALRYQSDIAHDISYIIYTVHRVQVLSALTLSERAASDASLGLRVLDGHTGEEVDGEGMVAIPLVLVLLVR